MSKPNKHEPHDAQPSTSLRLLGAVALIFVVTCAAYAPVMQAGFIWDDDGHVTRPELQSWHGLARIWFQLGATQQYYPLLHTVFWIEHRLWGDQPLGYHLLNLLLHATAASLVYLILRKLEIPGALLAAAIFALHPVMVESVAWITEQKNTLSAAFYLSAMLVYLHFDENRKPGLYAAALVLFVLGLLSKTVTATLPAALLVIFWWQRGRLSWRRDVLPLAPFFVLGAIAGLFTAWVERNLIGAEGAAFDLSLAQRGLLAGQVIWFYLGKLLWPAGLIFIYPRWDLNTIAWWQWLFPLGSIALLVALWLVRRKWRGPLAGWLFFVGTLFPVLGFFNVYPFVYSFVADHFQYLASLGMIILAAAGVTLAISCLPPPARWIGYALCVALIAVLAALTWQQTEIYSDAITLYKATIAGNQTCWMPYNNLGIALTDAGRPQEAIDQYHQALRLKSDRVADIRSNLGNALDQVGRVQEAIEQYQEALRLKPDYVEAYYNWGNTLARAGRTEEAIPQYQQALRLKPDFVKAHLNLGAALGKAGRLEEAIAELQEAVRLKPDSVDAYANMAKAYVLLGKPTEAIAAAEKALALARSADQIAVAQQIETWLNTYRAQQAGAPAQTP